VKRVLLLVALLLVLALAWSGLRPPPRTLYVGGAIVTLDAAGRVAEALAVEGDRIAAVGSRSELAAWERGGARVVDLAGSALLPGFIDAHGHFPGVGLYALYADLNSPPIGDVRSVDDVVERLAARAAEKPAGEWIVGWSYDDTLLTEGRHPTRRDLDRASQQHPILVWHISAHLASANSLALARAGVDAGTPDPEGGLVRREPGSGEPDGVLEENAIDLVAAHVPQPGPLEAWRIVREATARYLRAGVTTAQNGYAEAGHMQALAWLAKLGLLPLRLVVWPGEDAARRLEEGSLELPEVDPSRFRVGARKLIADGSIQGYTGYLTRPYHVPPGDDPGYRGYPRIPRDRLLEQVARHHAAGRQLAVHGNGDASIDDILDAFENAQRLAPRSDARHVIIHAQMTRDDQLDRMRELGVIPSFFSLHTYYWGDRHRDIFMGPVRAARMSPARSARDRGVRFTLHCDAPVVPMEPLRLVWSAVNRRSTSGAEIGRDQRITPLEALRAVTVDAAHQHFEEREKGSLEPGKLADLVVLSRSPLDDPEHIDDIEVLETIVGGETVYCAEASPSCRW
jgi:predicted amidohydrolase YtcJ